MQLESVPVAAADRLHAKEIRIRGLRKSFGPTEVLHGVDLTIEPGDFVGLMGPNGAGKSTLIKILDGVYGRTSGDIFYGEESVSSLGRRSDVGFIHQDLGLIEDLTVSDNLRLGASPMRSVGPLLDRRREREAAGRALALVGLDINVDTLVGQLSPGQKTLVAVARVFDQGASVLFVDEATSTLPPIESRHLIAALTAAADRGATVIMVSHKLSEILDATKRIVVLLDGDFVADTPAAELDRDSLAELLVSHQKEDAAVDEEDVAAAAPTERGPELLRAEGLHGAAIDGLDLTLRGGDILGITGLPGSGLHDLAYLLQGSQRPTAGKVERARGVEIGFVPPHRETQGGFLDQSTLDNLTISSLRRWRTPVRLLNRAGERTDGSALMKRLSVKPANPDAVFGTLSGGNKQKAIFGRAISQAPQVYILCEPTRGVDVETRMEIYSLIRKIAREGAGVIVVSSDSEDLFAVCNQIAVIDSGKLGLFLTPEEATAQELEEFI